MVRVNRQIDLANLRVWRHLSNNIQHEGVPLWLRIHDLNLRATLLVDGYDGEYFCKQVKSWVTNKLHNWHKGWFFRYNLLRHE